MVSKSLLRGGLAAVFFAVIIAHCAKHNPVVAPSTPSKTTVFSEGFEGDLIANNWSQLSIPWDPPLYSWLTITSAAAHGGTKSITSDSSRCGILASHSPKLDTGIVGLEFYIMASALAQSDFTALIVESGGSSDAGLHQYGFGFDSTDSIQANDYDFYDTTRQNKNIAKIQVNHWYKCVVEVDFSKTNLITYYLDDVLVRTVPIPSTLYGLDWLYVLRRNTGTGRHGPKPYYVDDISVYTK
jgi:hypothetical protein